MRVRDWRRELTEAIPRPSSLLLRDRRILLGAGGLAGALAVSARFAHEHLLRFDRPLSEALRGERHQELFRQITNYGGQQETMPLVLALSAIVWWRCRSTAVVLPLAGVAGVVVDFLVKVAVARPRPEEPAVGVALGAFPSGHAIHAVILFGLLPPVAYILTRRRGVVRVVAALAGLAGAAVAFSRVYLGAHWPIDIVGSLIIGAAILLAAEYVLASRLAGRFCGGCPLHLWRPPEGRPGEEATRGRTGGRTPPGEGGDREP